MQEGRFAEGHELLRDTIGKERTVGTQFLEVESGELIRHVFPKPLVGDDIDPS